MPLAGLTDLPTELLIAVLENPELPNKSLYYLALLCRRLNLIALRIYFARIDIDLDAKSLILHIDAPNGPDDLSALQISLAVSSMDRIAVLFSCTSIAPFLLQIKRVEAFISRLSSVKAIGLNLGTSGNTVCISHGKDDALRAWASGFGNLLNSVIAAGCSDLTIVNGGSILAYELDLPSLAPSFIHQRTRKLFPSRDTILGFRRVPQQGTTLHVCTFTPRAPSQLTTLDIDSTTLLVPPGLNWTLAALRASPITSLTLPMGSLPAVTWQTVLPLIAAAAPGLTTLSLLKLDPYHGQTPRHQITHAPPPADRPAHHAWHPAVGAPDAENAPLPPSARAPHHPPRARQPRRPPPLRGRAAKLSADPYDRHPMAGDAPLAAVPPAHPHLRHRA
ncbi:hypothetical protein C8R46DRAFT_1065348 [Mycena filopes]|nr:hypothetical protein C8R46DRAFT_1065348 [Mycena filopes]